MSITALEIKQKSFSRSIRGYDAAEVTAFLNMLSSEWEQQVSRIREMERDLNQLNDKLDHYRRIEGTLHETLETARENADQRLENARRDAQNRVDKAEMESEHILQKARQQRQEIRQSTLKLLERRQEIIGNIKTYLAMAQRTVNAFEKDTDELHKLPPEAKEKASGSTSNSEAGSRGFGGSGEADGGADLDALISEID